MNLEPKRCLAGCFWLRIFLDIAVELLASGLQSSEGLTEAGESASKLTHLLVARLSSSWAGESSLPRALPQGCLNVLKTWQQLLQEQVSGVCGCECVSKGERENPRWKPQPVFYNLILQAYHLSYAIALRPIMIQCERGLYKSVNTRRVETLGQGGHLRGCLP